jgi:hypothetical protein
MSAASSPTHCDVVARQGSPNTAATARRYAINSLVILWFPPDRERVFHSARRRRRGCGGLTGRAGPSWSR